MDIIIKKANENEIKDAILLSERYCYRNTPDRNHGFTVKPIMNDELEFTYIAKYNGKIIGVACAKDFSKENFGRYGADKGSKCKEIGKVTVDENYRGMKVASKMLEFILNEDSNAAFYATIMEKPVENKASKRLFNSLGFRCYKIIDLFHEDIDLKEEVGLYVYENKI